MVLSRVVPKRMNLRILILSFIVFRSYVVEHDWTQTNKKEGTFVLDSAAAADSGDGGGGHDAVHSVEHRVSRTSTPAAAASSRPSSTRSHG